MHTVCPSLDAVLGPVYRCGFPGLYLNVSLTWSEQSYCGVPTAGVRLPSEALGCRQAGNATV